MHVQCIPPLASPVHPCITGYFLSPLLRAYCFDMSVPVFNQGRLILIDNNPYLQTLQEIWSLSIPWDSSEAIIEVISFIDSLSSINKRRYRSAVAMSDTTPLNSRSFLHRQITHINCIGNRGPLQFINRQGPLYQDLLDASCECIRSDTLCGIPESSGKMGRRKIIAPALQFPPECHIPGKNQDSYQALLTAYSPQKCAYPWYSMHPSFKLSIFSS